MDFYVRGDVEEDFAPSYVRIDWRDTHATVILDGAFDEWEIYEILKRMTKVEASEERGVE